MNRCSLLNPWNMIHLKTIVNHCTRKGYIPLRNGRKKKLQKQSILICVKFFLALYMTYLFYCINRFRLEWPLRKGMVMGVSMCKMLHLFSLKVVAFTLNYIGKLFSILWPKRKPGLVTKELYLQKIILFGVGFTRFGKCHGINAFVSWI